MKVVNGYMILNNGTKIKIDEELPNNKGTDWIECSKHKVKYPSNRAMCIMCSREIWKK